MGNRLRSVTDVSADEVPRLAAAMGVPIAACHADVESPDPQGELLHAVARVLRRDPETVGQMGIALSGDEPRKGDKPTPVLLQVGANLGQIAEAVVDVLRPALDEVAAAAARKALEEHERERAHRRAEPPGEYSEGGLLPEELLTMIYARERISTSKARRIAEIRDEPEG